MQPTEDPAERTADVAFTRGRVSSSVAAFFSHRSGVHVHVRGMEHARVKIEPGVDGPRGVPAERARVS